MLHKVHITLVFKNLFNKIKQCQFSKKNLYPLLNYRVANQKYLISIPYKLPFLIKLKFVKTLKTTTPVVTFQYIRPCARKYQTYKYSLYLAKKKKKSVESILAIDVFKWIIRI